MQFIPKGPDIPEQLLQAHEEGRVVFFCGAGISRRAGLPDFQGLVKNVYRCIGETPSNIECHAFRQRQFDTALHLLERRLQGGRQGLAVREALKEALIPDLSLEGAIDTHEALLMLARSREGVVRLVTTNFDGLFHEAAKHIGMVFESYEAPMLPIPKPSRWDGLVFLHGLLPEQSNNAVLNRLVLTSGDFGLAYLTERWAARFVSELFRNYNVCFVGYSINDPVLRYMMDALAADQMLGEPTSEHWAMGACVQGEEQKRREEWESRNVTPILYELPALTQDHSALYQTLEKWSETYTNGVSGKESIVVELALAQPSFSTTEDNFVGRMLWALSDPEGRPAKLFAELNPVPPLEWLWAFSESRFQQRDLAQFGVAAQEKPDEPGSKLRFSLIDRPAPYHHSARMQLVAFSNQGGEWDRVMRNLAKWLLHHWEDPRLVLWFAQSGGHVHPHWLELLEDKLKSTPSLESPSMRTLWRLVLSGRLYAMEAGDGLDVWLDQLHREGLTTTLRLKFRDLLAPMVRLDQPFEWGNVEPTNEPKPLSQLVSWEVTLACDGTHDTLLSCKDKHWLDALPHLLDDIQQLLQDALALRCELRQNDSQSAHSWIFLPSIHLSQPRCSANQNWVNLILLLRESWLSVHAHDLPKARRIAQCWFDRPESTFKRLAFFAASQEGCIPPEQWAGWLLADDARWLWNAATELELHKLLEKQCRHLSGNAKERLEAAILAGPRNDTQTTDETEQHEIDRWIWERLDNLHTSGSALGDTAEAHRLELSPKYQPGPIPAVMMVAPPKRCELVLWLISALPQRFKEDLFSEASVLWEDVCVKHPLNSLFALTDLPSQGNWQTLRWRTALSSWRSQKVQYIQHLWRYAAPRLKVQAMPDVVLQEMAWEISLLLKTVSEQIKDHEKILLTLCWRLLDLPLKTESGITVNGKPLDCAVTGALNHPVGRVARALINIWLHRHPKDNDQLPADLQPFFKRICDGSVDRFRHGRVLLGSQLITLFRVDLAWTESNLLPLLCWINPAEARAVWQGFLRSARLNTTLLVAIKADLLNTAEHYDELGSVRKQYSVLMTHVALDQPEGYSIEEFRLAFAEQLPLHGLEAAAQALYQALEGAGDQREEFWENRFKPFWEIWPKSADRFTPQISKSFALLVLATGSKFPEARKLLHSWHKDSDDPHVVVQKLNNSGLCSSFPDDALTFLFQVIDQKRPWRRWQISLRECLKDIAKAAPALENNPSFQELSDYAQREP